MHRVIVIEFLTLDGVMHDPDGGEGSPRGGWAFRFGPQAVAGDKFRLGEILDTGALVLGRRTWERFSRLWPTRDDPFSMQMNRIPKLVASRSLTDAGAWSNSTVLEGELVDEVTRRRADQDLVVIGSASVIRALREHDLIDEYRLIVFPTVLGEGDRLFEEGTVPVGLQLEQAEPVDQAVFLVYRRTPATG